MEHRALEALLAGVDTIRQSPRVTGLVELIVRRPAVDDREVVTEAVLDRADGLVGDSWRARGSRPADAGGANTGRQVTVMNARAAALVAGERNRWQLAGDQLYVDLDLSAANVPPGTRLEAGSTVLEVTDQPHRGCAKFAARFGRDAVRFVNSDVGRELNLRGVNARVVRAGVVRTGDSIRRLEPARYSAGVTPTGHASPVPPSPQ